VSPPVEPDGYFLAPRRNDLRGVREFSRGGAAVSAILAGKTAIAPSLL